MQDPDYLKLVRDEIDKQLIVSSANATKQSVDTHVEDKKEKELVKDVDQDKDQD